MKDFYQGKLDQLHICKEVSHHEDLSGLNDQLAQMLKELLFLWVKYELRSILSN